MQITNLELSEASVKVLNVPSNLFGLVLHLVLALIMLMRRMLLISGSLMYRFSICT